MNIAAVMAILDVDDLDHMAKSALLCVACRADRYTGRATLSIGQVAADMAVAYDTARFALYRAVSAGLLTVDKRSGHIAIWHLNLTSSKGGTSLVASDPTSLDDSRDLTSRGGDPSLATSDIRSLWRKEKEAADSVSQNGNHPPPPVEKSGNPPGWRPDFNGARTTLPTRPGSRRTRRP